MPTAATGAPTPSRLTDKDTMSPARQTSHDLDELIAEITVDAHDEDEQLMGFANAFDEVELPQPGSVVGEDVEVLSIGAANARAENARAELIATCRHAGRTYDIALLDVNRGAVPRRGRRRAHPPHPCGGRQRVYRRLGP